MLDTDAPAGYQRAPSGLLLPERTRRRPQRAMLHQFQQGQFGRSQRSVSSANADAYNIYTNLLAWWGFEQNNSDTYWDDLHTNNHDLTLANGAATSARSGTSGISGRRTFNTTPGSALTATNHCSYILRANTAFDFGDVDFSIMFWFKSISADLLNNRDSIGIGRYYSTGAGQRNYAFVNTKRAGVDSYGFIVRNAADSASTDLLHPSITPDTLGDTHPWAQVVCVHDSVNDELRLYINNVKTSVSHSGGVYSGGNQNFCLGNAMHSDTTIISYGETWSFQMDETCVATRAFTDADVAYLYNAGAGKSYAAVKADAGF
jgi:hypothetical protein